VSMSRESKRQKKSRGWLNSGNALMISFYSPQMVATVNTTKYTTENDLTKKEKKEKKEKKKKRN